MTAKPRIALLGDALDDFGGSVVSSGRMTHLLEERVEMIPISFEMSYRAEDWAGVVRRIDAGNKHGYVIKSADSFAGSRLAPDLGERMLSRELMVRALAEQTLAIAKRENVDAIHAYGGYDARPFVAAYVSALLDKPLILTFCGQDLERGVFGYGFSHIRQAVEHAALISCKSEKAAKIVRGLLKPSAEIRIIRNHVSETYFDPSASVTRWATGPIIGCFAAFRRIVGLDVLLKAYSRLLEERDLTLALGGPVVPSELEYLNRQIEALPSNAQVWRMGKIPHARMLAACRACDLVVAPSYADTSPYKVLEPMLAGVPVVATTAGGIPELVSDGQEALLVEPGNDEALATAITRLLDDPELAQQLSARARARVLSEFTRQREQNDWIDAYRSIGLSA
jgi:glycosyltransferase involved in cell wall biosynthesis